MAFTTTQLNQLFKLWSARGPALANLIDGLLQFESKSPYDVSAVAGPVLLIAQSFASAQVRILDFIMNDSSYAGWSLDLQGQISGVAVNWQDVLSLLSNIAFSKRLPRLDTLYQAALGARYYGAVVQSESFAIKIRLESFLNVPTMAGITVKTFWSASSLGLAAISRLDSLDWALSAGNLSIYYGVGANTDDLMADALEALTEISPLQPDINLLLDMVASVSPADFSANPVVSISAQRVMQGADIESIAFQFLGDADRWIDLANFNKLMWPYVSDDPIERLGRPEAEAMALGVDAVQGAGQITLANSDFSVYKDQRIVLQDGANSQIVVVTDASDYPVLKVSPALNYSFMGVSATLALYPPDYDTGVVLGTGDKILIPSFLTLTSNGVLDTADTDIDRYGSDLMLSSGGDLVASNGDFSLISGKANVLQAVHNRFEVKRGQLIHLPLYGHGLDRFIGLRGTPYYAVAAAVDAIQTALQDPRTPRAIDPKVQVINDSMLIDFGVSLGNQRLLLPVRLDLPVS